MRSYNPIRQALKKNSAFTVYSEMKDRLEGSGGLTIYEWDWFDRHQKQFDPEDHARGKIEAARRMAIDSARAHLSVEDLEGLIAEKLKIPE